MFDKYNLVFRYFGMLSSDVGSTSHETPGSVSKKPKHDISVTKKTTSSEFDAAFLSEQKQLNNNMSTAAASMSEFTFSNTVGRKNDLEDRLLNFQLKRLDAIESKQDAAVKLYDARITALEGDIMKLEEKLEGSSAKQHLFQN